MPKTCLKHWAVSHLSLARICQGGERAVGSSGMEVQPRRLCWAHLTPHTDARNSASVKPVQNPISETEFWVK